jgi:hypothetical protein
VADRNIHIQESGRKKKQNFTSLVPFTGKKKRLGQSMCIVSAEEEMIQTHKLLKTYSSTKLRQVQKELFISLVTLVIKPSTLYQKCKNGWMTELCVLMVT